MDKMIQLIADTAEENTKIGFDGSDIEDLGEEYKITLNSTFLGDELSEMGGVKSMLDKLYPQSKVTENSYLIIEKNCKIEVELNFEYESICFEVYVIIKKKEELNSNESRKLGMTVSESFDSLIKQIAS